MNPAARCPACGRLLPGRNRQRGGRKPRYCSGACKARAYRDRQRSGMRAGDAEPPLPPTAAARHARATEIRRQVGELTAAMADTASGQQALFASPGTARRMRLAGDGAVLHRLIAELAALATAATVTKHVTLRRAPAGTTETAPLFDKPGIGHQRFSAQ
jgi:hypothetical protein